MEIHRPQVFDFQTRESLENFVSSYLIDNILDTNANKGVVRIGLTGGKSSLPIYKKVFADSAIIWDKLHLFLTDERQVSLDSPDSNYKQIRDSLGDDFMSEVGEFNHFETNFPVDIALKNYTESLQSLEGAFFDINILSVGADGHIASLFPNSDYLRHQKSLVIETIAPPELQVARRLTLTVESLLNSEEIILLIIGDQKKGVLGEILEGDLSARQFPAKFLLAHPKLRIYHILN